MERKQLLYTRGRTLISAELPYSTTEKVALAVIEEIKNLKPYLYRRNFTVHTDHHALKWLMTIKDVTRHLAGWHFLSNSLILTLNIDLG